MGEHLLNLNWNVIVHNWVIQCDAVALLLGSEWVLFILTLKPEYYAFMYAAIQTAYFAILGF